ncbi:hypothetical protein Droror1_Dr00002818 [Drosera rotundifolia]
MATRCPTSVPRSPAPPSPTRSNPTLSPPINLHFVPNAATLGTLKAKVKGASRGGVSSMAAVPNNSNYVVPLDQNASCITRPLAEILRDLNKRIPENIVNQESKIISWYHANRMLSFYAPGWCGEVRDVIFSEDGNVTVVYRVTVRGSDGEAHRESTGTASGKHHEVSDAVAAAEEAAFVKACSRFGLGLYLYHEE